jgi:hypothetical protein
MVAMGLEMLLLTYEEFLATHPSIFTEAEEPLEADHLLQVMRRLICSNISWPTPLVVAMRLEMLLLQL